MSPVGVTRATGWQIGVSRTVPLALDEVWARVEDPTAWLGEAPDDVRSWPYARRDLARTRREAPR